VQAALLCSVSPFTDVEQGIARAKSALEIFLELNLVKGAADALMMLGQVCDSADGLLHYEKALKIRQQVIEELFSLLDMYSDKCFSLLSFLYDYAPFYCG